MYTISRLPKESIVAFHTRVANEIQTMKVKIISVFFTADHVFIYYDVKSEDN